MHWQMLSYCQVELPEIITHMYWFCQRLYNIKKIHKLYAEACKSLDKVTMSNSLLCDTWRIFLSGRCLQKARTVLCATCNKNTMKLQQLRSLDEEKRFILLKNSVYHLKGSAVSIPYFIVVLHSRNSSSLNKSMYLSTRRYSSYNIDFAQQVFNPNSKWDQCLFLYQ